LIGKGVNVHIPFPFFVEVRVDRIECMEPVVQIATLMNEALIAQERDCRKTGEMATVC